MRAVARWCAANGWPVHPLAPKGKTPPPNCSECRMAIHAPDDCPCHVQGGWCHGFYAATTDLARIDSWWGSGRRNFGVGVACGPAGLVVLDVDAHSNDAPDRARLLPGIAIPDSVDLRGLADGFDSLALLAAYRGEPNPSEDDATLRVRTPSGGLHIWYATRPHGPLFRSSTGSSSRVALAWQVDIRANGGYVVAPGTRTHLGTYEVLGTSNRPAPLPQWLERELGRTGHEVGAPRQAKVPPLTAVHSPLRKGEGKTLKPLEPLLQEVSGCATTPEGAGFSEKLNRAAYTAGGLVGAGRLSFSDALELLTRAAYLARPGQEQRSDKMIADALSAGARRPLHIRGRR
ncbi:bifunctional DNA primase/polymerase [Streptomyces sp. NPDC054775]